MQNFLGIPSKGANSYKDVKLDEFSINTLENFTALEELYKYALEFMPEYLERKKAYICRMVEYNEDGRQGWRSQFEPISRNEIFSRIKAVVRSQ